MRSRRHIVCLIWALINECTNTHTSKRAFAIVKDVLELADICSSSVCDCLVTEQAEDIYHPALSSKRQMTCPTPPPTPLRSFLLPPYHSCPTLYILSTTSPPSCYTHSLLLITIPLTSTAVSSSFFFHSHLMISPNTYSSFSLGKPAWPSTVSSIPACLLSNGFFFVLSTLPYSSLLKAGLDSCITVTY